MNIQTKHEPGKTILELEGRLDASWSDFLGTAIDHEIHRGEHFVVLDMTKVPFMSSAGIGVLLKYQRKLNSVGGSLSVCNPSENVLSVLKLMRLTDKLMVPQSTPTSHTSTTSPASSSQNSTPLSGSSLSSSSTLTSSSTDGFRDASGVQFEANLIAVGSRLNCTLIGDPASFANGAQPSNETHRVKLGGNTFCLGLGAIRRDFQSEFSDDLTVDFTDTANFSTDIAPPSHQSEMELGETIGVAGVGIEQPPSVNGTPDFQIAQEDFIPELQLSYGLQSNGEFSHRIRFEAGRSERGSVQLSDVVKEALDFLKSSHMGFVIVAEAETVVGASLIQSPTALSNQSIWTHPQIRNWLSFTSEQSYDKKVLLIAGVACTTPTEQAKGFLRPIREASSIECHIHAAVFPYRPLSKGNANLSEVIRDLFAVDTPKNVLHLLADERAIEGVGETRLMRGTCWCGPIDGL